MSGKTDTIKSEIYILEWTIVNDKERYHQKIKMNETIAAVNTRTSYEGACKHTVQQISQYWDFIKESSCL